MTEVTVIGSCVCRDLFEKDNGNFSFKTDYRFMSPISMISNPVSGIRIDFNNLKKNVKTVGGNWYKKNLINDINKTAFENLKERHGEYLIIDLAESRISIANIFVPSCDQSLSVSYSVSFRAHYNASLKRSVLKNAKINVKNPLDYDDDFWKKTIDSFVDKLLSLFDEEKIILIKNMPAKNYIDSHGCLRPYYSNDHVESIALCEILLPKLYKLFEQKLPNCKRIEIPPFALGLQAHKWGNHPFHFTDHYYEYLLRSVSELIFNRNKNNDALYEEYSSVFKSDFESALLLSAKGNNKEYDYSVVDLLTEYEEFNHLGKKQKLLILFALDKKNFLSDFKKVVNHQKG